MNFRQLVRDFIYVVIVVGSIAALVVFLPEGI